MALYSAVDAQQYTISTPAAYLESLVKQAAAEAAVKQGCVQLRLLRRAGMAYVFVRCSVNATELFNNLKQSNGKG